MFSIISEDEMATQVKETTRQYRYIVTQWTVFHDYDGWAFGFSILGAFDDRQEAITCANAGMEKYIRDQLDTKSDWKPVERDLPPSGAYGDLPNRFNKVIFTQSAGRRSKLGRPYGVEESAFVQVIQVHDDTAIDERLFNITDSDCGFPVFEYFNKLSGKSKNDDEKLFNLKRNMAPPIKCRLWRSGELTDGNFEILDLVNTYSKKSHFSRELVKCRECSQLYLKEFYEEIDWIEGDNPQHITYIPVRSSGEAELINHVGLYQFQNFNPCIKIDRPKGGPKKIYWRGKWPGE
jgi:hypothetical protein